MARIAYLLGAGASYGTRVNGKIKTGLPIVQEVLNELKSFHDWLDGRFSNIDKMSSSDIDAQKSLVRDIELLQILLDKDSINLFNTPDELEYTLFNIFTRLLPGKNKDSIICCYSKIKFILCCLLMYEQNVHDYDKRYNALLKKYICEQKKNISDDVFIMTWNYDQQMEIAYSTLFNEVLPVCTASDKIIDFNSNILKINGTANFYNRNKLPVKIYNKLNEEELFRKIINQYAISHKEYVGHRHIFSDGTFTLFFSWEGEWFESKKTFISQKIKDVEQLIVIGYSFPDANYEVDSYIINHMHKLRTVYIQDIADTPKKNFYTLLQRLSLENTVTVKAISDVSSFFIPK